SSEVREFESSIVWVHGSRFAFTKSTNSGTLEPWNFGTFVFTALDALVMRRSSWCAAGHVSLPSIIRCMRRVRSVGRNVLRKEGVAKATGTARYVDDLVFPGLLHGRTIRSSIPSGEVVGIQLDFDRSGFTIVDHRDIPGRNVVALIDDDQPCLA